MSDDFLFGVMAGVLGSVIFYLMIFAPIWRTYQNWVKQAQAADKPQSVSQSTKDTPAHVVETAQRARLAMFMFWVVLWTVALLILAWFQPSIWFFILQLISPSS